jgi:hypothetical protein
MSQATVSVLACLLSTGVLVIGPPLDRATVAIAVKPLPSRTDAVAGVTRCRELLRSISPSLARGATLASFRSNVGLDRTARMGLSPKPTAAAEQDETLRLEWLFDIRLAITIESLCP